MASLQTIRSGDIVEVEVKGRRGIAHVTAKQPRTLTIRPITAGFTWTEVSGFQVVKHWRLTKNTPKRRPSSKDTGHDAG